jgi:hypothetical protein
MVAELSTFAEGKVEEARFELAYGGSFSAFGVAELPKA